MNNDLYYGSEAHWGIGVVEDVNDPLQAGRVRVRIYGIHTPDKNELPTSDLPWSQVMMPMNSASLSGVGTSPVGVKPGSMVYGVFLDSGSYQQFLVQGTMPGIRKSSEVQLDFSESSIFNSVAEDFGNSKPEQLFNLAKAKGIDENWSAALVAIVGKFTGNSYDPESTHSNNRFGLGKFNEVDRQKLVDRSSAAGVTVFDYKIQCEYIIDRVSEEARTYLSEIDSVNSIIRTPQSSREAVIAILQNTFRESTSTDLEQIQNSAEQAFNAFSSRPNSGNIGAFESKAPAEPLGKFSIIETQENLVYYLENARDQRLSGSNRIRGLIVHHTDTYENMNTTAEEIDRWHLEKGFSEIGYHIVLLRDGRIQIGRLATKTGAHALKGGYNSNTIGIAFVGGLVGNAGAPKVRSKNTFTDLQWAAFDKFLQAWLQVFPDSFQKGHRDTDPGGRTDPEFNVEEYVASRYSDWKAIPAQQEQPTEQATITEVPTDPTTPPTPSTNEPEVASEPTDTSAVEPAPSGPIVLPDFDPINFPSIPDPNDTPILDLGDLLGGGGGTATGGNAYTLNNQPGSYYLNFNNFTNLPSPTITAAGDISGSVTLTSLGSATFTMDVADDVNLGGTPTATTATPGTNTTQIATTAFVTAAVGAAGGGDVTKVGTPVDNQIGVWTGDGTIEGDANLTWDATTFNVGGNAFIDGDLTFASDGAGANWLKFYRQQSNLWRLTSSGVGDVFTVAGNLITFPQNVLIQRGGLEVQNTLHTAAEPFKGNITFDSASTTFTAFKLNVTDTNSAADSKIVDINLDTNNIFNIDKDGLTTLTGKYDFDFIAAPTTALTATISGAAGNITDTNIRYSVTYVTALGETTESPLSTTIASASSDQIELTSIPVSPDSRVIARKIYRGSQSNVGGFYRLYIATLNDNTTTSYTDNIAVVAGGGTPETNSPTRNTTSGSFNNITLLEVGSASNTVGKIKIYSNNGDNANKQNEAIEFEYGNNTGSWKLFPTSNELRLTNDGSNDAHLRLASIGNGSAGIEFSGAGYRGDIVTNFSYQMRINTNDTYGGANASLDLNNTSGGNVTLAQGGGDVGIGGAVAANSKLHSTVDATGTAVISFENTSSTTDDWRIKVGQPGQYDGYLMIGRGDFTIPGDIYLTSTGTLGTSTNFSVPDGNSFNSVSSGSLAFYKPYIQNAGISKTAEISFRNDASNTPGYFTFSGFYHDGAWQFLPDILALRTESATDARIGMGTGAPSNAVHLLHSNPTIRLEDSDGGYAYVSGNGAHVTISADAGNTQSGSRIAFEIDGVELMRLNNSGALTLGSDTVAVLNSPTFTGTPAAPTATTGTSTTQIATTAFVQQELAGIGGVAQVTAQTNSTVTTNLHQFSITTYAGAEYVITVESGGDRQITKILVTHDGTTAVGTEYGTVYTNSSLATFDVSVGSGNVRLTTNAASTSATNYTIQPILLVN
jgi:hypothetical protein